MRPFTLNARTKHGVYTKPAAEPGRSALLWSYIGLTVALVLFATATVYGFSKLSQQSASARYDLQSALWLVMSLEREYLKFDSMLWRYVERDSNFEVDDLLVQYDVLWSRIELLRRGDHAKPLQQIESFNQVVPLIFQLIRDYETRIFDAVSAGRPLPASFLKSYRAMAGPIHRFMVDTHISRRWAAETREARIKDSRFTIILTLIGTLASTAMLFMIVIVQMRSRHSNLLRTRRALKQSEDDRKALHAEVRHRETIERERETLMLDLEARNEELERYAYTISHDLKSPLYTIQGFTGFLERDINKGDIEATLGDLGKIKEAVLTMGNLLDDILNLSRVTLVTEAAQQVSLNGVINDASMLLAREIDEYGAKLIVDVDLPAVFAEPQRLTEVFQNLISNAIKFSRDRDPPIIKICAEVKGRWVHCYVEDNGVGIAPEYHDRVFNLFERLDSDTTGTGVGLAIVKRIIDRQRGKVWIESEGDGNGCRFVVVLPLAEAN